MTASSPTRPLNVASSAARARLASVVWAVLMSLILSLAPQRARAEVLDGAPISPELAETLYARLVVLQEADGCRLTSLDTVRTRFSIGLSTPMGVVHEMDVATASGWRGEGRRAGGWALAVSEGLEADCAETLAAIERALLATVAPQLPAADPVVHEIEESFPDEDRQWGNFSVSLERMSDALLALTFCVLLLGSVRVLIRTARSDPPPMHAAAALVLIWGVALALRLSISPRTFLHEYFHIAETLSAYLVDGMAPTYGDTGPSIVRLVGSVLGRPLDFELIFLTNAVLSSLAVPAVALLDLAWLGCWRRALMAAALLCILPQHLRFAASEVLFVQAITFGMWSLALAMLYLRSRRLEDALLATLALSLAMQARPEMLLFPAVLLSLVLLMGKGSWRVLYDWRTWVAGALLCLLLAPRLVELVPLLSAPGRTPSLSSSGYYLGGLVLLDPRVTPPIYWLLLLVGAGWGLMRSPRLVLWAGLVAAGFTLFSMSLFSNEPYNLRTQLLPNSFLVLIAAGVAPLWFERCGDRRKQAGVAGAVLLAVLAVVVVAGSRDFVTERRDQQLEWAFLENTVPGLPERGVLLTHLGTPNVKMGVFPDLLLRHASRDYTLVDVHRAASDETPWPDASDGLLYYQGMYCYFSLEASVPGPMMEDCRSVHEHYRVEPWIVEDLDAKPYAPMAYANRPFRIGFFRLQARERSGEDVDRGP